jgi:LPXTG-motif cell wall-anchored protein
MTVHPIHCRLDGVDLVRSPLGRPGWVFVLPGNQDKVGDFASVTAVFGANGTLTIPAGGGQTSEPAPAASASTASPGPTGGSDSGTGSSTGGSTGDSTGGTAGADSGGLPVTGTAVTGLATLGGALVAGGVVLLVARRRRGRLVFSAEGGSPVRGRV